MNKSKEERHIVLPGDAVGDKRSIPGPNTKKVGDRLVATTAGLLQTLGEKVSVLPMNGAYDPRAGDQVVGIITEANTGNWLVDIKAPWPAPMHVSEVPWRVDFGETTAYLKPGDAILCKVLFVDDQKKLQVTLKDRNLMKLEGGELMEVAPVKVARVIGKNGSMLNLIKGYCEAWLHVGQNGRIWLNGEAKEVLMAKKVIQTIADEAHLGGLTERITALLESLRPGGLDAGIIVERKAAREAAAANEPPAAREGDGEGRGSDRAEPRREERRDEPRRDDRRDDRREERGGRGGGHGDGGRDGGRGRGEGRGRDDRNERSGGERRHNKEE